MLKKQNKIYLQRKFKMIFRTKKTKKLRFATTTKIQKNNVKFE